MYLFCYKKLNMKTLAHLEVAMFFPKKAHMNYMQALSTFNLALCGVYAAVAVADVILNYRMAKKCDMYIKAAGTTSNEQTVCEYAKEEK